MEDIVAVELKTSTGGPYFVMTFGRVQNAVDPAELQSIVLSHASAIGLGHATAAEVCRSLRDARDAPYFYEALIDFSADIAGMRDRDHEEWRREIDREMRTGKHLWYLGDPALAP